ncbi:M14 metallopeptidase family protein [Pedobacter hartonius]|uniref:Zinc carboxypeptidase n=1 Tax=Pedobacter hartonius TaxID=425514 RepID=A0A1H4F7F7_9SPHI|nr:M14 metallopeptidase family protein [Pedobacter hartonius]SEA92847.1 Zinc carboxypeptidase [Pedobacter hartonius]
MKITIISLFLLFAGFLGLNAQVKSPDDFLGYPLGSKFTPHHQVIAYFKYLAGINKNIQLISYGKTYENRELMVAVISSGENMGRLEQIRKTNIGLSRAEAQSDLNKQPAILWMSYNVHGNEASSSETSMKTLYALSEGNFGHTKEWLKNTVVLLDPCLNPDGRERYVNFYNSVVGAKADANPSAREHNEPWPRGRVNHYYFDLNRDWAWQTQVETQQRLALYHQWMPEVHVDFHEQSYDDPYYFAPAAEPVHQDITPFQREFQIVAGKNNAKYFDESGWKYFTKERFDLLYPSYGDTYPLYNGAIGMTYEQGGINSGLTVQLASGDTLTLKDRINHHFAAGMATVETVSDHARLLVSEFRKYFDQSMESPPGNYKSYIVKADNLSRLRKLAALLSKNCIEYTFGGDRTAEGYSFETKKTTSFTIQRNDLVVNLRQPAAVLANVLFEPETKVTDSNTYDITAWALPYAYGLSAFASKENLNGAFATMDDVVEDLYVDEKPYVWILPWNALEDAKILIALQRLNIKVRIAEQAFTIGTKTYPEGSLLVYRMENERINMDISDRVSAVSKEFNKTFASISSDQKGKDFGSSAYPLLSMSKVAMVADTEVSAQSAGEIWHLFEEELKYPLNIISEKSLGDLDLAATNVLILPDGQYLRKNIEKLESWISRGGKIILLEGAISSVDGIQPFDIKKKEFPEADEKDVLSKAHVEKDEDNTDDAIPGAIYKVDLDKSHPLTLGLGAFYTLKTDDKNYELLTKGRNVGVLKPNALMAGVVGRNIQRKLSRGLVFGVQPVGKGNIVYFSTDVLFRSFWESGKQLFVNAIFLVK